MRNQYPWKLGATSFVIPDSVEKNVQYLGGRVADIQLLFFESSWQARLPHVMDMGMLADLADRFGHSYTVHLPLDLHLGSDDVLLCRKSIDEVCRIVEMCQPVEPRAYDLHLNQEFYPDYDKWCDCCRESLVLLRDRLGSEWQRLCIENINYDFGLIADVIRECETQVCVDFGHLHQQNFSDADYFRTYRVSHVHLHGVRAGHDHQPLTDADIPFLERLAQEMVDHDYDGIVTLEVYKAAELIESLILLEQAWDDFLIL
jgi:sugar phosphate isomerase/epimerase